MSFIQRGDSRINSIYTFAGSARGSGHTTSRIARETLGGVQYDYTYDVLGNITKIVITENGTSRNIEYFYDDWSQLTRENNQQTGKTYLYTYDDGGNLTTVKEYAYTARTGTPSGTAVTKNYSYGNSSWKDQLTSYNGQNITYIWQFEKN